MSNQLTTSLGYISPVGDYGLKNSQALGGVSHLWQDFFSRAMQDQLGDSSTTDMELAETATQSNGEPIAGSQMLAQIQLQRLCDVKGTQIDPSRPLFLPIAEFELDLLDKAPAPFSSQELVAQQQHLEFDSHWVRPIVTSAGQPLPEPGPAPQPRPLYLPIAELEWNLADKAAEPYDETTLGQQDTALKFDNHWARPVVLQNLRIAA